MPAMNVFDQQAFSLFSLTAVVNDMPWVPGRIGELGIFEEMGVRTVQLGVERKVNNLYFVPVSERGAPPTENEKDRRDIRDVRAVRVAIADSIYADEIQGMRSLGSESELATVQQEVNFRLEAMTRKLDATMENHRLGAVKGKVMDSDGTSVILDMFDFMGVTEKTPIPLNLALESTSGRIRTDISGALRDMEDALGAVPYTGVMALCGRSFFDLLVANSELRETYVFQEGEALRARTARRQVFYGGILWEEYSRKVGVDNEGNGGVPMIADGEARMFPIGSPGTFLCRYAPADYMSTVNTIGLPRYATILPSPDGTDRSRRVEVQSNFINLCVRPQALRTFTEAAP